MKVLHIAKVTGVAGSEKHLFQLLPSLRRAGIDARMVMLGIETDSTHIFVETLKNLDVPVTVLSLRRHIAPGLFCRLRDYLQAEKPAIAHTHLIHADVYGIPAARAAGVPHIVSTRHNTDRFRRWFPLPIINWILWKRTDRGIAISNAVRDFMIRVEGAPPKKLVTIYYGLGTQPGAKSQLQSRRAIRQELGIPENALVIGSICRLIAQKGIAYGLEAFAQIHTEFPNAYYIIGGDGKLRAALMRQVEQLELKDRVRLLGWRQDAAAIYDCLDIFLAPSLWEGFGMVLLEAMAHRLPIISTHVDAIPEVVIDGEAGFLVPPADAPAIANSLSQLMRDQSLRMQMGMNGRKRLEEVFSIERMAQNTIHIYQELMANSATR